MTRDEIVRLSEHTITIEEHARKCEQDPRACSFEGRRVAVKTWYSADKVEWTALVNRDKGWQGNEADKPGVGLPRVEMGIAARMWKLTRNA